MPELDLINVPKYQPTDPYHWEIDNIPIEGLIDRLFVLNAAVDSNTTILRDAQGTAGTLANRINQSLEDSGALKGTAIDTALHGIDAHTDGGGYVRMTDAERAKLATIASDATDLAVDIETISTIVNFDTGIMTISPSDTITWRYTGGSVKADMVFPVAAAHEHHYDITPVHLSGYTSYKTTSVNTAYMDGSLRVYINGIRISQDDFVYAPGDLVSDPWTLNKFTETSSSSGTFALTNAITANDIIKIDFDRSLV